MTTSLGLIVAILAAIIVCCFSISCRDEQNNEVDWLIAYKLPKLKGNANKLIKEGAAYAYFSSSDSSGWKLSSNKVSDKSGTPFANTFAPVYSNASHRIGALYYNDQPPNIRECSTAKGHSKGVVLIDDSDGTVVWIVHSVPHFPPANGSYIYPGTGFLYGQHYFCVSLSAADAHTIGAQFQYTRPCYYGVNLTASQFTTYTELVSSAQRDSHVTQPPWQRNVSIKTRGGASLIHFAKYINFGADLYSELVAPTLGASLRTETWQNDGAADRLNSTCSTKFTVENVLALNLTIGVDASFQEEHDHAKWAVAVGWQQSGSGPLNARRRRPQPLLFGSAPVVRWQMTHKEERVRADPKFWVCLGDINRELTQFKRAGGTLCIYNELAWTQFNSSISQIERCP